MRIGTRSVLYGAHCFFLHPWFVARAYEHKDGKVDTWTSDARQRATIDDNGVWK